MTLTYTIRRVAKDKKKKTAKREKKKHLMEDLGLGKVGSRVISSFDTPQRAAERAPTVRERNLAPQ